MAGVVRERRGGAAGGELTSFSGSKRPADGEAALVEKVRIVPLGGGREVGRSCIIIQYKGKTIMLDCGALPAERGEKALPNLREIDPSRIDIVIISHFHIDHAASLPHLTERMEGFRARVFATHPTVAVMRMMLSDYVRLGRMDAPGRRENFSETDLERCLERMEPLDLMQRVEVEGISLRMLPAGHVLGAAMVRLEFDQIRILYTGDYSFEADRHLPPAVVPTGLSPDVLICESTFGMDRAVPREERENLLTNHLRAIIARGGKALLPVFSFGRAQELLLLLEEEWRRRPELHRVPVYFLSPSGARAIAAYRSFRPFMSRAASARDPFQFRFVRLVRNAAAVPEGGPCVALAPPGMLQSGDSRTLLERWAPDPRNGLVIVGYHTEGTLAREMLQRPPTINPLRGGPPIPRRCSVEHITFVAHASGEETLRFVDTLRPASVVLVHGEKSNVARLRAGMERRYRGEGGFRVYAPDNFGPKSKYVVERSFVQHRPAKAVGRLAGALSDALASSDDASTVTGLLVRRFFQLHLLSPADLPAYTPLSVQRMEQSLRVPFRGDPLTFLALCSSLFGHEHVVPSFAVEGEAEEASAALVPTLVYVQIAGSLLVHFGPPDAGRRAEVRLTWTAGVRADTLADTTMALLSQAERGPSALSTVGVCGCGTLEDATTPSPTMDGTDAKDTDLVMSADLLTATTTVPRAVVASTAALARLTRRAASLPSGHRLCGPLCDADDVDPGPYADLRDAAWAAVDAWTEENLPTEGKERLGWDSGVRAATSATAAAGERVRVELMPRGGGGPPLAMDEGGEGSGGGEGETTVLVTVGAGDDVLCAVQRRRRVAQRRLLHGLAVEYFGPEAVLEGSSPLPDDRTDPYPEPHPAGARILFRVATGSGVATVVEGEAASRRTSDSPDAPIDESAPRLFVGPLLVYASTPNLQETLVELVYRSDDFARSPL